MLNTVKSYISELSDISFADFYQKYICEVQDQNILMEIRSIKSPDIDDVKVLLAKLKQ